MTSTPFNPEVLIVARESRGRTQKDVADAARVTQGLISKVEHGLASPNPEQVAAIASFLECPERLFFEPGRVREVGSACLYHSKRKTLPAKPLKQLEGRMFLRNVNVRKLFEGLDIEGDRIFHAMDPDEYDGSAVEVARALKAAWRIPEGPIANLTALIESAGGVVLMDDFNTRKLFGMSCWTTHGQPLFFLNSAMPTAELRWTMAHELGHLTMHAAAPQADPEEQADAFAGEFLAPQALFRTNARRLTFDRLANLKTYWRIPMKAVIKRAETVGAIDRGAAIRLYKQYSARGYNRAEPYPLAPESPTLVEQAARVHLDDHGYSYPELAEAVRLLPDEFERAFLGAPKRQGNVVSLFGARPASA